MKRKKGFTMMEVLTAVVLIILLAAISVPVYKGYTEKVMLAEGHALLGTIKTAQQAYYGQYGNFYSFDKYDAYKSEDPVLGFDISGNKYFTSVAIYSNRKMWYFSAKSYKPKQLWGTGYTSTELCLQYNLTKGSKIVDYPKDQDETWFL